MKRSVLALFAAVTLGGCASYVDVKRQQPVLYRVSAEKPGVGLLHVSVDDEVLAKAPNDFSNMTGLVAKVAKDYAEQRGGFNVVNYTDLGFTPRWTRQRNWNEKEPSYLLSPLEGVPAGVQTPLVMVAKVLDWRTFSEPVGKNVRNVAAVKLMISTWTREGKEVTSEVVDALAREGEMTLHLKAGNHELVRGYQHADGRRAFLHQPEKRDELFMNALREAVGVHLFPFFPHEIEERQALIDDAALKPGVEAAQAGRWDEAMAQWEGVAKSAPKSHGALYNLAVGHMVRGDDAKAYELFAQAATLEDKFLYRSMRDLVKDRLALRKEIGAAGVSQPQTQR
ncbi:MAG: hypothetical protein ACT4TC_15330 [Myxococcaceae bacterium]